MRSLSDFINETATDINGVVTESGFNSRATKLQQEFTNILKNCGGHKSEFIMRPKDRDRMYDIIREFRAAVTDREIMNFYENSSILMIAYNRWGSKENDRELNGETHERLNVMIVQPKDIFNPSTDALEKGWWAQLTEGTLKSDGFYHYDWDGCDPWNNVDVRYISVKDHFETKDDLICLGPEAVALMMDKCHIEPLNNLSSDDVRMLAKQSV